MLVVISDIVAADSVREPHHRRTQQATREEKELVFPSLTSSEHARSKFFSRDSRLNTGVTVIWHTRASEIIHNSPQKIFIFLRIRSFVSISESFLSRDTYTES